MKKTIFTILLSLIIFAATAQKDIQLNLQNADLRAFIETVSKITGKNFVIDPAVQGSVTLLSPDTMDKKSLYDIFLTVLEVHGFSAIKSTGGVIKVVPSSKSNSSSLGYDGITQVHQLSYINATQILPTLQPLMPAGSHIAADGNNNMLIISGEKDDVQRAMQIIDRIDQANTSNYEVIRLQNASAANIAKTVNALIANEGQKTTNTIKVIADERTNSILLQAPKSEKLRLKTLVTHLDTPIESAGNTEVIYLKNANAEAIAEVLSNAKNSISQNAEGEKINLTNSNRQNSDVDIRADETTNSLIVTAPPATMRNFKQVIAKLDIRRSQVLVEAIIAEVNTNDIDNLGVQWYGTGNNGTIPVGLIDFSTGGSSILGIGASYAEFLANETINTSAISSGATFGVGNENLGVLVNALKDKTDSNILSTPSLLVMDNEEAEMIVGENIPYVTGSFTTSGDGSSNPFTTVERQDIGVKLTVKPQISEGDTISLNIYQEVSDVLKNDPQLGPSTSKRALKTAVLVENNQILVLGGLIDNQQKETEQKVPLLGDIPVIGNLFKSRSKTGKERNLMIFIRPSILRSQQAANYATQQKYDHIRNIQLGNPLSTGGEILPPLESDNPWQNPAPVYERSKKLRL